MRLSRIKLVRLYKNPALNPYTTLDSVSAYRTALSNGDLTYQPSGDFGPSYYAVSRSTSAKNSGKFYFETNVTQVTYANSTHKVGISYDSDNPQDISANINTKFFPNSNTAGPSVKMCAVDIGAGKVWVGQNGTWPFDGDPETGANPNATFTPNSLIRASVAAYYYDYSYGDSVDVGTVRFDPASFTYTIPVGFVGGWSLI